MPRTRRTRAGIDENPIAFGSETEYTLALTHRTVALTRLLLVDRTPCLLVRELLRCTKTSVVLLTDRQDAHEATFAMLWPKTAMATRLTHPWSGTTTRTMATAARHEATRGTSTIHAASDNGMVRVVVHLSREHAENGCSVVASADERHTNAVLVVVTLTGDPRSKPDDESACDGRARPRLEAVGRRLRVCWGRSLERRDSALSLVLSLVELAPGAGRDSKSDVGGKKGDAVTALLSSALSDISTSGDEDEKFVTPPAAKMAKITVIDLASDSETE